MHSVVAHASQTSRPVPGPCLQSRLVASSPHRLLDDVNHAKPLVVLIVVVLPSSRPAAVRRYISNSQARSGI
eukprot:3655137-Heterocapsa_arctica.AAC.1